MDYSDHNQCAQIIADLNSLARMASLEGARQTRQTAALLAEEYRFRRDAPRGEVELRTELRAVCRTLRLCSARYGPALTPDWSCPETEVPPVLIPGGLLMGLIDRLLDEHLLEGLPFFLRIEAREKQGRLSLLIEEGPGGLPKEPLPAGKDDEAHGDESVVEYGVNGGERRLHILRIPL